MFLKWGGPLMRIVVILLLTFLLQIFSCSFSSLQEPIRHIRNNDHEKARQSLEKLKVKKPGDARVHYLLGDTYGRLDRYQDMMREFNAAKKYNLGFESKIAYSIDCFWTDNYNEGMSKLTERDYHSAIRPFKNAIFLRSQKIEPYTGIGQCYFHVDSLTKAREAYESAIVLKDDWEFKYNLAEIYFRLEEYEKCISLCDDILVANVGHKQTLLRRAYSNEALHRDDKAISDFIKYLLSNPERDIYIHLSLLYEKNKKFSEALMVLNRAFSLQGEKLSIARLGGKISFRGNFYYDMMKWYSYILNEAPNDVEALNNLMIAYQALGQKDKLAEIKSRIESGSIN